MDMLCCAKGYPRALHMRGRCYRVDLRAGGGRARNPTRKMNWREALKEVGQSCLEWTGRSLRDRLPAVGKTAHTAPGKGGAQGGHTPQPRQRATPFPRGEPDRSPGKGLQKLSQEF